MKIVCGIILLILFDSCGFLAMIDPPERSDHLRYVSPDNAYVSFYDSNALYIAKDSQCDESFLVFEFRKDTVFYISTSGDTTPEFIVQFYNTIRTDNFSSRYKNYGHLKQRCNDTFDCELQWRDSPWNRRFIMFTLVRVDSSCFKAIYLGVRPYKYRKTFYVYGCDKKREIYFYKVKEYNYPQN